MKKNEITIVNTTTGERKTFDSIKELAPFFNVPLTTVHYYIYKEKDLQGWHFEYKCTKYHQNPDAELIKRKDYTLEKFNAVTAVFSSSKVLVEGDTEEVLKAEISAYVKAKIKENEPFRKQFILVTSIFGEKFYYEITFLFEKKLTLKEIEKKITDFLPYPFQSQY